MRFLVDECLSPTIADLLQAAGHDAVHVVGMGLGGQPDVDVMAVAVADGRILVSADTDFGELLARTNAELPSLILHRGAEVAPAALAALLLSNLDQVREDLEHGAVVVILDDRIRVRRLPIGATTEDEG
ncbi:MAG: DUF5615 family PIN-like protein [Sporichthyaceae bacterium]